MFLSYQQSCISYYSSGQSWARFKKKENAILSGANYFSLCNNLWEYLISAKPARLLTLFGIIKTVFKNDILFWFLQNCILRLSPFLYHICELLINLAQLVVIIKKSHSNQDQDLCSNIMFAKCSDDVKFSMMLSGGYVFYIRIGLNNVFGSENKEETVTLQKTLAGHTIWSNNALFRKERNEIHRHAKTFHSKSWRIRILGNAASSAV